MIDKHLVRHHELLLGHVTTVQTMYSIIILESRGWVSNSRPSGRLVGVVSNAPLSLLQASIFLLRHPNSGKGFWVFNVIKIHRPVNIPPQNSETFNGFSPFSILFFFFLVIGPWWIQFHLTDIKIIIQNLPFLAAKLNWNEIRVKFISRWSLIVANLQVFETHKSFSSAVEIPGAAPNNNSSIELSPRPVETFLNTTNCVNFACADFCKHSSVDCTTSYQRGQLSPQWRMLREHLVGIHYSIPFLHASYAIAMPLDIRNSTLVRSQIMFNDW